MEEVGRWYIMVSRVGEKAVALGSGGWVEGGQTRGGGYAVNWAGKWTVLAMEETMMAEANGDGDELGKGGGQAGKDKQRK